MKKIAIGLLLGALSLPLTFAGQSSQPSTTQNPSTTTKKKRTKKKARHSKKGEEKPAENPK